MPIRQITIIGTGLIGGSFGLAVKANGFRGKVVGCDQKPVLAKAKRMRAVDIAVDDLIRSCSGSDLVVLAAPVGKIIEQIGHIAPHLPPTALLTDVGSTKSGIVQAAQKAFGLRTANCFLGGHPMAGKENSGVEFADAKLFQGAVWFVTPIQGQELNSGRIKEYVHLLKKIGARIAALDPTEHDQLCAWISHVPQMIATSLASLLVEEFGTNAPLLESGGRALREMTRIAASPYSMWRDIALTNKTSIADALLKLEQKLAHVRENLDTRELEAEFEQAHQLTKYVAPKASEKKARKSRARGSSS